MATDIDDIYEEPRAECWNCGGEGHIADCDEEWACLDPGSGCEFCTRRCDICEGKGGWPLTDDDDDEGPLEKMEEK